MQTPSLVRVQWPCQPVQKRADPHAAARRAALPTGDSHAEWHLVAPRRAATKRRRGPPTLPLTATPPPTRAAPPPPHSPPTRRTSGPPRVRREAARRHAQQLPPHRDERIRHRRFRQPLNLSVVPVDGPPLEGPEEGNRHAHVRFRRVPPQAVHPTPVNVAQRAAGVGAGLPTTAAVAHHGVVNLHAGRRGGGPRSGRCRYRRRSRRGSLWRC